MKTIPEIYNYFVFWSLPGPPDPPRNCTLTNQTHDSLQVDCQEGFGSGLSQEFHMEVLTDLQVRIEFFLFLHSPSNSNSPAFFPKGSKLSKNE